MEKNTLRKRRFLCFDLTPRWKMWNRIEALRGGAGEWRFRRLLLSYGVMVNTPPFGGGTPGSNPGSSTGF